MTLVADIHAPAAVLSRPKIATRLLLLVSMVFLVLLADPRDAALGLTSTQQFIPAIVALLAGAMYLIVGVRPVGGVTWQDLFLSLFIGFVFIGGNATAMSGSLAESFANLSYMSLIYFPFRLMASQPGELDWFVRRFGPFVVLVGLAMSVQLIIWQVVGPFIERGAGLDHIYHEEVFLLLAAIAFAATTLERRPVLRGLVIALLLTGELFSFKNTGFITAALSVFLLFALPAAPGPRRPARRMLRVLAVFYLLLAVLVALILLPYYRDALPDGSASVRLYTYQVRWQQFLDAPLFGLMFLGTPRLAVPNTNLYIPSHSDLMDLFAFGGLFGALMFGGPLLSFLARMRGLRRSGAERVSGIFGYALLLGLVVVWLFNPVWLQPKMSAILWIALAILAGNHSRRLLAGPSQGEPHA